MMGFAALNPSFCNGPRLVNPFCVIHSPGSRFCTGSALGRHLMGSEEDRSTNLQSRGRAPRDGLRSDLSVVPARDFASGRLVSMTCPKTLGSSCQAAAPAAKLKGVPSTSMRCMITASLRARATFAFFIPTRLASRMAQLLSAEPLTGLVSMM